MSNEKYQRESYQIYQIDIPGPVFIRHVVATSFATCDGTGDPGRRRAHCGHDADGIQCDQCLDMPFTIGVAVNVVATARAPRRTRRLRHKGGVGTLAARGVSAGVAGTVTRGPPPSTRAAGRTGREVLKEFLHVSTRVEPNSLENCLPSHPPAAASGTTAQQQCRSVAPRHRREPALPIETTRLPR